MSFKSNEEWKRLLTEEQFRVTRQKGTEKPFSGEYYEATEEGTYKCLCCGGELFASKDKYDSGTGWPSFSAPISEESIRLKIDKSQFIPQMEVVCSKCEAHLGHVFDDGPAPECKRYCINSIALRFIPKST